MPDLPQIVSEAWDNREGPMVFTTVAQDGTPNTIYVGCVKQYTPGQLVVVDNYFDKTRANIMAGSTGSLLFITKEGKAYQVKGPIEYQTSGEIYDDVKTWVNPKHPAVAAAVVQVTEVYSGSEKLL